MVDSPNDGGRTAMLLRTRTKNRGSTGAPAHRQLTSPMTIRRRRECHVKRAARTHAGRQARRAGRICLRSGNDARDHGWAYLFYGTRPLRRRRPHDCRPHAHESRHRRRTPLAPERAMDLRAGGNLPCQYRREGDRRKAGFGGLHRPPIRCMPARRLRMATSYFSRLRTPRTAYTASKPAEQACNGNGKNFRRSMHWEERMKVLMAILLAALAFGVGTATAQDK